MLKQSVVQETVADMSMPTAPLPPLNNLPQWSRINTLDKARLKGKPNASAVICSTAIAKPCRERDTFNRRGRD